MEITEKALYHHLPWEDEEQHNHGALEDKSSDKADDTTKQFPDVEESLAAQIGLKPALAVKKTSILSSLPKFGKNRDKH